MNEAAGFIMDVPNSTYFAHTLRRAIAVAERHSHRLATPEHLLTALLDDPDAKDMLEGARADIAALRVKLTDVVNRQMSALHAPGAELRPSLEFDRVLTAAADLASRSPKRERDGAFVLAALVWEPEGPAANLLRQSGLTSEIALAWLNAFRSNSAMKAQAQAKAQAKAGPKPVPSPPQPPSKPAARQQEPIRLDALPLRPEPARQELTRQEPPRPEAPRPDAIKPEPLRPEPMRPEPPRADAKRSEPVRPAPRQDSASKEEETLEEMLARVRSILDDGDEPAREAPQLHSEPPAQRSAPPPETLAPASSGPRPFPPRQAPEQQPSPAPAPGGAGQSSSQSWAPPPGAPERPQAPLPFGGLPRSAAAAATPIHPPAPPQPQAAAPSPAAPPPYRDPSAPAPLAPSRSLAPIARPKPRSELGKLVENIPRAMKVAEAERIEVRLSKADTGSLLAGFQGRGELTQHNVILTRAMSVMLRAPEGGFLIENLSPETQWIVDRPSFIETEPFGRWRWMVTPQRKGRHKLLLIISSRNVDEKGMIGDTPLPDQVIEVSVQANFRRSAEIAARWAGLLIAGGVLTEAASWTLRLLMK